MSPSKQLSHRHHYVPQFYLDSWQHPDRLGIWVYRRDPSGVLRFYRRSTKAVGFANDLYMIKPDGLPLSYESDAVEIEFFQKIDTSASQVHKKLLASGITALTDIDRMVWAIFMNSLIERTPEKIDSYNDLSKNVIENINSEFQQKWRNSYSWPELQSLFSSIDKKAATRNAVLSGLTSYILDRPVIEYFCQMLWQTVKLPDGLGEHFVSCDKPVIVNGVAGDTPIYVLSIALSPNLLLVMHKKVDEFDHEFITTLATMHNYLMAKQAKQYLFSDRELSDGRFIKNLRIAHEIFDQPSENVTYSSDSSKPNSS